MKLLVFIFIGLLCCSNVQSFAQSEEGKTLPSLSFRHGLSNFTTDYLDFAPLRDNYRSMVSIEVDFKLRKGLFLAVPIAIGVSDLPRYSSPSDKKPNVLTLTGDLMLQARMFDRPKVLNPYVFGGIGGMLEDGNPIAHLQYPAGAGFTVRIGKKAHLDIQSHYRFSGEELRQNWRHEAGLRFYLGHVADKAPKDKDGDRIIDAEDLCPDQAGPITTGGCPDGDNDGIADKDDDCPLEAGLANLNGCPDNDGDGIANLSDLCPNQAGTLENGGCPDTDGDGIVDVHDKCPTKAGPEATKGCPDRDGDGVTDDIDQCPDKAGPATALGCPDTDEDGFADNVDKCPTIKGTNQGCPELKKEEKEKLEFAASAIQFETGKADILPVSYKILDEVVDILKKYDQYKVTIDGHTDSVGDANKNQTLSEKRAQACFFYLRNKGINEARMKAKGYGESKPIGDNLNAAGRQKNRRTEFNLFLD